MIFEELSSRGLLRQFTHENKIKELLNHSSIKFYIGFDPTADSLHVGHLLQLITAQRLALAGHQPILLLGESTASVGDPTGKTDMRKMLDGDSIVSNASKFKSHMKKIVPTSLVVSNGNFFDINYLKFIREVGVHFSVNAMLRAECFKSRMENGLSFLEFNYMIMQSYDFFKLNKEYNCVLQVGGDDQWSNILGGLDLIKRMSGNEAYGLTISLLLTSDGKKMGKTEAGAVWLDPLKTSPFDFFQFWRNVSDAEVIPCLKMLTFMSLEEIDSIDMSHATGINEAKKKLAFEVTKIVHGEEVAKEVLTQASNLFERKINDAMVSVDVDTGCSVIEAMIKAGFAKSKTDARNLISGKGVFINDELCDLEFKVNKECVLRKGKKHFCKLKIL